MKKNLLNIISLLFAIAFASCGDSMTEKVIQTHPNGQPFVVYIYNKDNQWVASKEYYESGILRMEGSMDNGVRQGNWTSYFPDGKVQSTGVFEKGVRVGPTKIYYENGHLWMEGSYVDNHRCGEWIFYDEQGYETARENLGPCN